MSLEPSLEPTRRTPSPQHVMTQRLLSRRQLLRESSLGFGALRSPRCSRTRLMVLHLVPPVRRTAYLIIRLELGT